MDCLDSDHMFKAGFVRVVPLDGGMNLEEAKNRHELRQKREEAIRADEHTRLAAMAPEEVQKQIAELLIFPCASQTNWQACRNPKRYEDGYCQQHDGECRDCITDNIVYLVWPIAEARIQAEREKVLRQVGEWLEKHFEIERCDETVMAYFEEYYFMNKEEFEQAIKSLKSGKMPGEAKS